MRKRQRGAGLVEGLTSTTILSVGILGLIAMQGELLRSNTDSQVRMQAGFFAASLAGMAAAQPADAACVVLNTPLTGNCASPDLRKQAEAWLDQVSKALPGSDKLPPMVAYDGATGRLTVTLRWQLSGDDTVHNYLLETHVGSGL